MHEQLNKQKCKTCIDWLSIDERKLRGTCLNKRLNDVDHKYVDTIQPDRRYYPRLIMHTGAEFGCVHHVNIILK